MAVSAHDTTLHADAVHHVQELNSGPRLFVSGSGQAEEDTRAKLGDCLHDEPGLWSCVKQVLARLADHDPAVRAGSRVLGAHMTEQERTHHR